MTSFFKYWKDNKLDRFESTRVNLSNLIPISRDLDNPIENK